MTGDWRARAACRDVGPQRELCMRRGCSRVTCRGGGGHCRTHHEQLRSMGLAGFIDSAPTIAHLEKLRVAGWTFRQIGEAASMHGTVPAVLLRQRYSQVRKSTADAILAVEVVKQSSRLAVDSTGTRRRVQALAYMGWNLDEVARRAGMSKSVLCTVYRPTVSHAVARQVEQAYERLSHLRGPSTAAAVRARKHAPPMSWDDDTIDDPAAVPNLGSRAARSTADVAEEARFLIGFGMSTAAVAKRLGLSESWIRQLLGGGKRAAA